MKVIQRNLKIGKRLRLRRITKEISQVSMADKLGMDNSALNHYEHGRRDWTPELVQKYEEALA